jgi:hypothetical protein
LRIGRTVGGSRSADTILGEVVGFGAVATHHEEADADADGKGEERIEEEKNHKVKVLRYQTSSKLVAIFIVNFIT